MTDDQINSDLDSDFPRTPYLGPLTALTPGWDAMIATEDDAEPFDPPGTPAVAPAEETAPSAISSCPGHNPACGCEAQRQRYDQLEREYNFPVDSPARAVPQLDLSTLSASRQMWITKNFSDCIIRIVEQDDTTTDLPCHKCILATIPYFRNIAFETSSFKEAGMTQPYVLKEFSGGFSTFSSLIEFAYGEVPTPFSTDLHRDEPVVLLKAVTFLGMNQKVLFDEFFDAQLEEYVVDFDDTQSSGNLSYLCSFFTTGEGFDQLITAQKKILAAVNKRDEALSNDWLKKHVCGFLLGKYSKSCEETRVMILQILIKLQAYSGAARRLVKAPSSAQTFGLELQIVGKEHGIESNTYLQFVLRRSCKLAAECGPAGVSDEAPAAVNQGSSAELVPKAAATLADVDNYFAFLFPSKALTEFTPNPSRKRTLDTVVRQLNFTPEESGSVTSEASAPPPPPPSKRARRGLLSSSSV